MRQYGCDTTLTKQNVEVLLLEQASEIGEIGTGIQLGPNAFTALDALGAGEAARASAVISIIDSLARERGVHNKVGQISNRPGCGT